MTSPLDIVRWDKAGELVMLDAARLAGQLPGGWPRSVLYKNNTDNKGASYGAHENYLMPRATPFSEHRPAPHPVLRQPPGGVRGRAGWASARTAAEHGFQISQRADYFEVEVGLETTLKRPIINTRDEPHADPEKYRRLHVIIGDANLAEIVDVPQGRHHGAGAGDDRGRLHRPRTWASSHRCPRCARCPTTRPCGTCSTLRDGRRLTAVQLQLEYLDLARKFVEDRFGTDADEQTLDVLGRWESVLDRLERDPFLCAAELDWVAKLKLLTQYRDRDGLDWDDPKLHLIDLQYSDVRPEKGLYHRLVKSGRIVRLLDDQTIEAAMHDPPEDTRAYFRGRCLEKYAEHVAAASWDSVIFDLPGRSSLQRVPTVDPLRGSRAHVGALLDSCDTAEALFTALHEVGRIGSEAWHRSRSSRASPPRPRKRSRSPPRPTSPSARKPSTTTWTRSSTRSTRCSSRTPRTS